MVGSVGSVRETLDRIQGEYQQLPGLRLTFAQAQRLWGMDRDVCRALLAALVDARYLALDSDGTFVRNQQVVN